MILKLNKEIYPQKAVQKAVSFYKQVTNFKLKNSRNYILVSASVDKNNAELIKNEFLNFVLGIIRQ
jgi:hypothetical protein